MHADQVCVNGEDYVGLLGFASDRYAVVSPGFRAESVLGVPTLKTRVYGTGLAGMFCAGNGNGILVPYFVSDGELKRLRDFAGDLGVNVERITGRYTALGNLIACNDRAALAGDVLRDTATIRDVLGVEVVSGEVADHSEVGANLVVTNRGFLAHPEAEAQLRELSDIFRVKGMAGTVNYGVPYVKSGLIANSNGYVTGTLTTGIELQRIDDALNLI